MKAKHFVVADLHFSHYNVIKYEKCRFDAIVEASGFRPDAIQEMVEKRSPFVINIHDQVLADRWNAVVGPDDIVFVLGDFTLTKSAENIKRFLGLLNGRKRLIMGNHDTRPPAFYIECGFESASRYPVLYNKHIFLSHEPLPKEIVPEGFINFFGHVHSNKEFNWERGHCVSIEQLINFMPRCIDCHISTWEESFPDRHNNHR